MQKQIQGHENNEGNPDAGPQGSKKPTKPKKNTLANAAVVTTIHTQRITA
jgi:hypothetical protein